MVTHSEPWSERGIDSEIKRAVIMAIAISRTGTGTGTGIEIDAERDGGCVVESCGPGELPM